MRCKDNALKEQNHQAFQHRAQIIQWVTYIGGHIPQDAHQKGSLIKGILVFLMQVFCKWHVHHIEFPIL